MTDETATEPAGDPTTANSESRGLPPIIARAQYIKDLSFEAPTTPGIFSLMQEKQPDININLDVNAHPIQDDMYEVVIHVRVRCKVDDSVAFICELSYGGLFSINVPPEHRQPVILIECPRLLFPFVRQIIADASRDGGFPPLMLAPVDFVMLYQQKMQELAAQNAQAGDDAGEQAAD